MRTRDKDRANKLINEFITGKPIKGMWLPKGWQVLIPDYAGTWNNLIPVAKLCVEKFPHHKEEIYRALEYMDKEKLFTVIVEQIKWCNKYEKEVV